MIHGTHLALVQDNVYNDVRGATIYIEDGNEMYNRILYNVAICPWSKSGEKRGCTIPGKKLHLSKYHINLYFMLFLGSD